MTVTRYNFENCIYPNTPIAEKPEGDYVRHADYERDIAELNQRLIDRTSAFMDDKARDVGKIRQLEQALADYRIETERLRAALAWAMDMKPSPCRCLTFSTPPHICLGHAALGCTEPVEQPPP